MILYSKAAGPMASQLGLPVKLGFAIITKAKTPVVQVLPVPVEPARIAGVANSVAEVWAATGSLHCPTSCRITYIDM